MIKVTGAEWIERGKFFNRVIRKEVRKVIRGTQMDRVLDGLMIAIFMPGDIRHVMLKGPPGTGKTLLALTLMRIFRALTIRLTGNEDDRPEDLLGYWKTKFGTNEPLFAPGALTRQIWQMLVSQFGEEELYRKIREYPNLAGIPGVDPKRFPLMLLYDEINRSTQQAMNALLEPLQELQATLAGITIPFNPAFLTVFSLNPFDIKVSIEPSRAFVDRIAQEINVPLPNLKEMEEIITYGDKLAYQQEALAQIEPIITVDELLEVRKFIQHEIEVTPPMVRYIAKLLKATDQTFLVEELKVKKLEVPGEEEPLDLEEDEVVKHDADGQSGVAGRVAVVFRQLVKTEAFFAGRRFVRPEDAKSLFSRAIEHHIVLHERLEARRSRVAHALAEAILKHVPEEPDWGLPNDES